MSVYPFPTQPVDATEQWLSWHITDSRLRGNKRDGEAGPMMKRPLATLLLILLFAAPARAAQCGGDFNVFLSAMARDAQAAGLPRGDAASLLFGFDAEGKITGIGVESMAGD